MRPLGRSGHDFPLKHFDGDAPRTSSAAPLKTPCDSPMTY
ncbi:hypothetical protein SUS17_1554 [Sphingomonas sp. S17]|nr:hypothetical protein SUS17_1554 [Sphingomonas sp. S17]